MFTVNEARKAVKEFNEEIKKQNEAKANEIANKIGEEIKKRAEQGCESYTIKVSENEEVLKMLNNLIFQAGYPFVKDGNEIYIIKW
jgi:ribosomal protein L31E